VELTAVSPSIDGTLLPIAKMREIAAAGRAAYEAARPFPHFMIDDFLDPAVLECVLAEFPTPEAIRWQRFDSGREIKLASAKESTFGPVTRRLMHQLNSITFLEFVSQVTGIDDLIPDPSFDGGGLHQIEPGGKLGVHADYNKHPRYGLDRRVNVLIYLNKEWREEYGGHLELWDVGMTKCEARVLPIFNRLMMFGTTDFTYHGHPDPLRCPAGMTQQVSSAVLLLERPSCIRSLGRPSHSLSRAERRRTGGHQPAKGAAPQAPCAAAGQGLAAAHGA
jgi:Rps23 Pro-64 3,4-dihydroxylase Tpa1-like proline 4-hydroxylase